MKISGWQKESFIDYSGKCSSVIFTSSCNYKCPTCHAKKVLTCEDRISENDFFNYLDSRKGWIEGIVICGGEPTRERTLIPFLEKIKDKGLKIKLDTNGSDYDFLGKINKRKLVDYVAMDVKGPIRLYAKIVGKDFVDERDDVGKGIMIVSNFPDYEFRTTIVPLYENEKLRWMSPEELGDTARLIYEYTGIKEHKYYLQNFVAEGKDEMLDERFAKENLPRQFWETPKKLLEECLTEARKYLPNAKIRGDNDNRNKSKKNL